MKQITVTLLAAAALAVAGAPRTFTGTVTDSMCGGGSHAAMGMQPDAKCVRECVKAGAKYALFDGRKVYTLSDQRTPAQFAGSRVKVTGTLSQSGVIQVQKIEAAK